MKHTPPQLVALTPSSQRSNTDDDEDGQARQDQIGSRPANDLCPPARLHLRSILPPPKLASRQPPRSPIQILFQSLPPLLSPTSPSTPSSPTKDLPLPSPTGRSAQPSARVPTYVARNSSNAVRARSRLGTSAQESSPERKLPPPPANPPRAWRWHCHACGTTYRLSCTRRCLECSHEFCSGVPPQQQQPRRRGKARGGGPCRAEFDYEGWKCWGAWKRNVATAARTRLDEHESLLPGLGEAGHGEFVKEHRAEEVSDRTTNNRLLMFLNRRHDCSRDCDYPSECRHAVMMVMRKRQREEEEAAWWRRVMGEEVSPLSPVERRNEDLGAKAAEMLDSPASSSSIFSFFDDDADAEFEHREGKATEVFTTDEDGVHCIPVKGADVVSTSFDDDDDTEEEDQDHDDSGEENIIGSSPLCRAPSHRTWTSHGPLQPPSLRPDPLTPLNANSAIPAPSLAVEPNPARSSDPFFCLPDSPESPSPNNWFFGAGCGEEDEWTKRLAAMRRLKSAMEDEREASEGGGTQGEAGSARDGDAWDKQCAQRVDEDSDDDDEENNGEDGTERTNEEGNKPGKVKRRRRKVQVRI